MRLKYVPNPDGYLKPAKAKTLDEFFEYIFEDFPDLLKAVFSKKEAIDAVVNNNFETLFDIVKETSYGEESNGKGCNLIAFCHFLYLLDIDFMQYLSYDYIKKNFFNGGEWKKTDKKDTWSDYTYFEEVEE